MEETGEVTNFLIHPPLQVLGDCEWSEYCHIPWPVSMNFTIFQNKEYKMTVW
jgi:hypothetical protein